MSHGPLEWIVNDPSSCILCHVGTVNFGLDIAVEHKHSNIAGCGSGSKLVGWLADGRWVQEALCVIFTILVSLSRDKCTVCLKG